MIETLRPLPIRRVAGSSAPVLGLSVVRGEAIPVIDLGEVLGAEGTAAPTRFVVVRAGGRSAALSVEGVIGLQTLDAASISQLPPLLKPEGARPIDSTLALDDDLVLVLGAGRLVPEEIWVQLDLARGRA